jgi:hypothetical protein
MIEQYKTIDANINVIGIHRPSAHPRKPKDTLAQDGDVELVISWGEETGEVESIIGPLLIPASNPLMSIRIPPNRDNREAVSGFSSSVVISYFISTFFLMIVRVNNEDAPISNEAVNVRYHPASGPQTQKFPPLAQFGRLRLVCIFILPQKPVICDGLIGVHVGGTLTGDSVEK